MSKLTIFVSATIVLIFVSLTSEAKPLRTFPEEKAPQEAQPSNSLDENMSLVEPAPVTGRPRTPRPSYYPYRQQLTFRAGQTSELSPFKLEDFVLGFQYLFPKFLSPKLEAGADLHKGSKGHLHAGLRWIYFERGLFRPSYKLSLDHLADADDRLATLTQINNYYARLTGTLEYVFWNPLSLRLEPELIVNFKETQWIVTLGLSRGW